MESKQTWKDKWISINSKFATAIVECTTSYHSDQKAKDSIEAVIADIWSLKDWLSNDPKSPVTRTEIDAFLNTPEAFNIRACGDIETGQKHFRVDNPHREDTVITWEGDHNHPSGRPVVFTAKRTYRDGSGDDTWIDILELVRRSTAEWQAFLLKKGLL